MLEVRDLKVSYGAHAIIRGINLELRRGETVAVVGESGTGKTTLGLSLMGLIEERAEHGRVEGEILVDGQDLNRMDEEGLRQMRGDRISMVFQNIDDALNPVHTVFDQVKEPVLEHDCAGGKGPDRVVRDMLEHVGLPEARFHAYPHQLSLGQKQRALIAMAFVCDPEVIILDEPTSSLDAPSRRNVNEILRELCADRVALVISHDLAAASELADRTAVLYGGHIVEVGETGPTFSDPRHPYSRGLFRSYPDMSRAKDLQGIKGRAEFVPQGCAFQPRCTQSIPVCSEKVPPLEKHKGRLVACHRGGVVPLLQVRGLSKSFDGEPAVRKVDLTLFEGETLVLVGQSGAGKTTLARCVMGLEEPETGDLELDDRAVEQRDRSFFRRIQMVFQNPREALSHRLTVLDAVREPLDVQAVGERDERRDIARRRLDEVELPTDEEFLHRYPHELSGGELQRVVIARALVLDPKLLIADEPTSSLDASVQAKVIKLLNGIQEHRGLAMLYITHNIALARKIGDRLAVMKSGRIVEEGLAADIFRSPQNAYTQQLIDAAPSLWRNTPSTAARTSDPQ